MPILNVSSSIKKYALETIRVPISPLGDCPQCQGNGYRDGICPDCNYIDARVQEAIQEWQDAMGIQQVIKQQQESLAEQNPNAKAAYRSLAFSDLLPSMEMTQIECPKCGENNFQNESSDKDNIAGNCKSCGWEIADKNKGTRFNNGPKVPKVIGPRPEWLKEIGGVQRNFPKASETIELTKNKLKKTKKKSAKEQQMNPGAKLDNSMVVVTDDIARGEQLLRQKALIDAQPQDAETSEEQQ